MTLAAIGGIISGVGSAASLMYQSAIAGANSQQANLNANSALQKGEQDTVDIGNQGQGDLGGIYANQGASGFSVSSPSFVSGVKGFLGRTYQSITRTQEGANQDYANYKTQGNIYNAQSKADMIGAPLALAGGIFSGMGNTAGSLLGSAKPTVATADYIPMPTARSTAFGNTGWTANFA